MTLPPSQHTVLARLSDGEWRRGIDLIGAGAVLGALNRKGLIRDDTSGGSLVDRLWTITPDGQTALEVSQ